MRITILTGGSLGDVQPYIALGLGLQARDHPVCLATHPIFESIIRSRGLAFFPVECNPRELLESEEGQSLLESGSSSFSYLRRLSHMLSPLMKRFLMDSWNACQDAEVIVYSLLGRFAGYHIAEKLGIPFYQAYLQPDSPTGAFPSIFPPAGVRLGSVYNRLTHLVSEQVSWQLFRKSVNEARREVLNLPPMPFKAPFGQMRKQRYPVLYGYSPSILPKPSDWDEWLHVTGYWFLDRPPSWQPPADLVDFLASGPPPVCIGFGSMNNVNSEEMTELVLQALARAGQRGVLLTGWGALSNTDLPDEVLQLESVPHDWLFPQAAAVVHHGGVGTTHAGLHAGVPSIIIPFFADQFFWGRRVFELGVGPQPIPRRRLSAEQLAAALRTATGDEGIKARAAALGQRVQTEDGVARAVELFHRYLSIPGSD